MGRVKGRLTGSNSGRADPALPPWEQDHRSSRPFIMWFFGYTQPSKSRSSLLYVDAKGEILAPLNSMTKLPLISIGSRIPPKQLSGWQTPVDADEGGCV